MRSISSDKERERGNTSFSFCFGWMQMRKVNDREKEGVKVLPLSYTLLSSFLSFSTPTHYTNRTFRAFNWHN